MKMGIISIKILVILAGIISMFSIFLSVLNISFSKNDQLREMSVLGQNYLANYNTYLYRFYGIYGVEAFETEGYFHHSHVKREDGYSVEFKESLSDENILKSAILDVMTIKAPANLMDQLLLKLDIVNSIAETQEAFEIKNIIAIFVKDLENSYTSVAINSEKSNKFPCESIFKEAEMLNEKWVSAKENLSHLEFKENWLEDQMAWFEEDDYQSHMDDLVDVKKDIKDQVIELEAIYNSTYGVINSLEVELENLVSVLDEMIHLHDAVVLIEDKIDDLLIEIEDIEIEGIADQLLKEIKDLRETLILFETNYSQLSPTLEVYIGHEIEPIWVSVLMKPYRNIELLDQIVLELRPENYERALSETELIDLNVLSKIRGYETLETLDSLRNKVINLENNAYVNQFVFNYKPVEFNGKTIDSNGVSHLNLLDFIDLNLDYNQVMINEYLIGSLRSFVKKSVGDYDYFGKYQRESCLESCEVEYILMGHSSETTNIAATSLLLYTTRTAMNTVHIYMDPDKLAYSKSIGMSVAGWSGLGEVVITHGLRIAWAMGESVLDMSNLIRGENVPLLKMSSSEWQLDLGFISVMDGIHSIPMTYHDYLRIYLLLVPEKVKLTRLINLLNNNLEVGVQSKLSDLYTLIRLKAPSGETLEETF